MAAAVFAGANGARSDISRMSLPEPCHLIGVGGHQCNEGGGTTRLCCDNNAIQQGHTIPLYQCLLFLLNGGWGREER